MKNLKEEYEMSYKPEVFVQGSWSGNALRFATEQEAKQYAYDLMSRWMLVEDIRAVPSDEPVNYVLANNELKEV